MDWNKPFWSPKADALIKTPEEAEKQYKVLTTERTDNNNRPVVIMSNKGVIFTSSLDGKDVLIWNEYKAFPFENIPETRDLDVWINIYPDSLGEVCHPSKEAADGLAAYNRIACIHLRKTYKVGEGLK